MRGDVDFDGWPFKTTGAIKKLFENSSEIRSVLCLSPRHFSRHSRVLLKCPDRKPVFFLFLPSFFSIKLLPSLFARVYLREELFSQNNTREIILCFTIHAHTHMCTRTRARELFHLQRGTTISRSSPDLTSVDLLHKYCLPRRNARRDSTMSVNFRMTICGQRVM